MLRASPSIGMATMTALGATNDVGFCPYSDVAWLVRLLNEERTRAAVRVQRTEDGLIDPNLIGIWSQDLRYGPGAQSDEMLFFKSDGTGWIEEWNFCLCSAEFFQWDVPESGRLILRGFKRLELSDDNTCLEEATPLWPELDTRLQVQTEETPSGKTMRVIRIKMFENLPDRWEVYGFDAEGQFVVREPKEGSISA